MSSESEYDETESKIVPLKWPVEIEAPTIYANELFITHNGNEFFLVFGEASPITPMLKKDELPDEITIKPVLKVAITHGNMLRFAQAIDDNTKKFIERLEMLNKEEDD